MEKHKIIKSIEKHDFTYKNELFAKLNSGEIRLYNEGPSSNLSTDHYLEIYSWRADLAEGSKKEEYLRLCSKLEKFPQQICWIWIFESSIITYVVFTSDDLTQVYDCIKHMH